MGKEITKFKRRREAQRSLDEISNKREMYLVIHYSCESFYDIKDGRTPRITSIAIRNFSSGQTHSFSIHKSAEQNSIAVEGISDRYDELEREMLGKV